MANRGYEPLPDDWDGRGQDTSDHSTTHDRQLMVGCVDAVGGRTSLGEQIRKGGMTRVDTPYSDNGSLPPPHKYQTGNPPGGYNVAAEKGLST